MSSKLDAFNDIKTSLEAIKSKGKRVIQHVGLWNNQFDNEEIETAVNFPCVYVEFNTIRWDASHTRPPRVGLQGNIKSEQKGITDEPSIITLHIGFAELSDVSDIFEKIDAVIEAVYFAVHGLEGEFYNPLLRIEERQDTDHDRVMDWEMDFQTAFSQCGIEDSKLRKIEADDVTLELTVDLDIDDIIIRTGDGEQ